MTAREEQDPALEWEQAAKPFHDYQTEAAPNAARLDETPAGTPVVASASNAELIDAALGDTRAAEEAFAELCERWRPRLIRYFLGKRLAATPDEAADMAHDTLCRVHGGRFDRWFGSRLDAWIWLIARHTGIDHRRRRQRHPVDQLDEIECLADSAQPLLAQPAPDPLQSTLNRALREEIADCIDQLPQRQRQVLGLYLNGLDQHEIAKILGCSRANVCNLIHSAMPALRKCLTKKGHHTAELGECNG